MKNPLYEIHFPFCVIHFPGGYDLLRPWRGWVYRIVWRRLVNALLRNQNTKRFLLFSVLWQVVQFVDVFKIGKSLDVIGRNLTDSLLGNALNYFSIGKFFILNKDNPLVSAPPRGIFFETKRRRVQKETFQLTHDFTGLDKSVVQVFHLMTLCYF